MTESRAVDRYQRLITCSTFTYHTTMASKLFLCLVVALVALSFAPQVAAFGAGRSFDFGTYIVLTTGNIPSYSYLEEKAFRHGDIEDVIANLLKAAGGGFLSRGTKFTPLDVKRVYFGNW